MERNANNSQANNRNARRLMTLAAALLTPAAASADLACDADFNADGTVDSSDLAVLLSAYDTPNADLTGDSMTDSADLSAMLAVWEADCIGATTDQNGDGMVDGRDFQTFADNWIMGSDEADINSDGFVDGDDYALLQADSDAQYADAEFTPDRRPIVMIRTWNASYSEDNPSGMAPAYRGDDAPQKMAEALQARYDEGWRRMWLLLPAGCAEDSKMNGSLDEWKYRGGAWVKQMRATVGAWAEAHPDATVGIYTGLLKRGYERPSKQELTHSLARWISMGIREFAFDHTSPTEYHDLMISARDILAARSARAIMEAFPVIDNEADRGWLQSVPVMALERFVSRKASDPEGKWNFDPTRTEAIVEFGRDASQPIDEMKVASRLAQGYVPICYSNSADERMKVLTVCEWFENGEQVEARAITEIDIQP
jgi:hypothetical protein